MLCWFLPHNNVNQPYIGPLYIGPLPLEPPSHLQPHCTLYVVTEHLVEFPVLYSNFPLAIYFTYGQVYVLMLLSQFIPPSLSPDCVHKSALYICASSYTAEERVIEK